MANTISPFGAQDLMHFGGSQRTEELQTYWIPSSAAAPVFNGDLVATLFGSSILSGGFAKYVGQGSTLTYSASRAALGVFRGCEFWSPLAQRMLYAQWYPGTAVTGSTVDVKCFVVTDSAQRFVVQATSFAIILSSNIGNTAPLATIPSASGNSSAAGNQASGLSGMMLGSSALTTISTQANANAFRIVDFWSNYAPGNWGQIPTLGGSGGFVNGTDNTNSGQWIIVEPINWENSFR